jgi:uncharacterized protein (DUF488 family)
MSIETFLDHLRRAGVTAVADVRTSPFSRRFPHFSKNQIRSILKDNNIRYVFLGRELGGRPQRSGLYCDGVADYEKMALEPAFVEGVERVIKGTQEYRIALMCSEHNPLDCHRCLLVGRALIERQMCVEHILYNGRIVNHSVVEKKLLELAGAEVGDFFLSEEDRLNKSYRLRARKVAFRDPSVDNTSSEEVEHN